MYIYAEFLNYNVCCIKYNEIYEIKDIMRNLI